MDMEKKSVFEQYTCPNCGGSIEFDSKSQKLKCPYCETEFSFEQLEAFKKISDKSLKSEINWQEENLQKFSKEEKEGLCQYKCLSCSAVIVTDKNTIATKCPYCMNPIVINENMQDSYKPELVIGFKMDKKEMMKRYKNFIGQKKFIPDDFKAKNVIDNIQSIYLPFWLFSGEAKAQASFIGTKTNFYSDSRYDYIDNSFYAVRREGNFKFQNLPVDGSLKVDNDLMESIEPFHDEDIKPFNPGYLAGYLAERYDEDADICKKRARQRAEEMAKSMIMSSISQYDNLVEKNISVKIDGQTPRYALMPVYILNTVYKNEKYTFAMNAQTGSFAGNLPVEQKKVRIYFLKNSILYTLITFLIFILIYYVYLKF